MVQEGINPGFSGFLTCAAVPPRSISRSRSSLEPGMEVDRWARMIAPRWLVQRLAPWPLRLTVSDGFGICVPRQFSCCLDIIHREKVQAVTIKGSWVREH